MNIPMRTKDPGVSMSQVVGLLNNSYKHITNATRVRARLCKLQKNGTLDSQPQVIKFTSCLPMVDGSLRVLRLLPPLKLVVMILLKVAFKHQTSINQSNKCAPAIYWSRPDRCHQIPGKACSQILCCNVKFSHSRNLIVMFNSNVQVTYSDG